MIAFYLVRGYKLKDLLNLTYLEKAFFRCARMEHYEEEKIKWRSILSTVLGGGE